MSDATESTVREEGPIKPPHDQEIFVGYVSDQTDDDNSNDGNDADNEAAGSRNVDHDSAGGGTTSGDTSLANGISVDRPETVPTQEISSLGLEERKRRHAAIENAVPAPKR